MKQKYRNQKHNGYDSRKEAHRAYGLKMKESAGLIKNLQEQVAFEILKPFVDNQGKKIQGIKYIADFVYFDNELNQVVIEDVKSAATKKIAAYIIKKKFVKKLYPEYLFRET